MRTNNRARYLHKGLCALFKFCAYILTIATTGTATQSKTAYKLCFLRKREFVTTEIELVAIAMEA